MADANHSTSSTREGDANADGSTDFSSSGFGSTLFSSISRFFAASSSTYSSALFPPTVPFNRNISPVDRNGTLFSACPFPNGASIASNFSRPSVNRRGSVAVLSLIEIIIDAGVESVTASSSLRFPSATSLASAPSTYSLKVDPSASARSGSCQAGSSGFSPPSFHTPNDVEPGSLAISADALPAGRAAEQARQPRRQHGHVRDEEDADEQDENHRQRGAVDLADRLLQPVRREE